jgi:hypothetical protein
LPQLPQLLLSFVVLTQVFEMGQNVGMLAGQPHTPLAQTSPLEGGPHKVPSILIVAAGQFPLMSQKEAFWQSVGAMH